MNDEFYCPGSGKCHGCVVWCNACGDVEEVCDARLQGQRCDVHPLQPELDILDRRIQEARFRVLFAKNTLIELEAELETAQRMRASRLAYDKQKEPKSGPPVTVRERNPQTTIKFTPENPSRVPIKCETTSCFNETTTGLCADCVHDVECTICLKK